MKPRLICHKRSLVPRPCSRIRAMKQGRISQKPLRSSFHRDIRFHSLRRPSLLPHREGLWSDIRHRRQVLCISAYCVKALDCTYIEITERLGYSGIAETMKTCSSAGSRSWKAGWTSPDSALIRYRSSRASFCLSTMRSRATVASSLTRNSRSLQPLSGMYLCNLLSFSQKVDKTLVLVFGPSERQKWRTCRRERACLRPVSS